MIQVEETRPRLLAVLAHPDDETFGTGGTLAFYAWCGAAVHLICATGGEVGYMHPELLKGFNSVAERREAELRCASGHLGLTGVHMLGYRDSGMPGTPDNEHPQALAATPLDAVAARVTHFIRLLRPHVVITFDPIGGYKHPDHIAIHRATVQAFHAAGDPQIYPSDLPPYTPQKLYFQTFPRYWLRLVIRLLPLFGSDPRRFGRNQDVDLTALVKEEFPIHAVVDFRSVEQHREAATQCHVSQIGNPSILRSILGKLLNVMVSGETYMRAYPPTNRTDLHEYDLFEGVVYEPV